MSQAQLAGIERPEIGGANELYPTPQPLCEAIVNVVSQRTQRAPCLIVEPSAGTGNFVRAVRGYWKRATICAVDIIDTQSECLDAGASSFERIDWMLVPSWGPTVDLIIGNPPFSKAVEHIEKGLGMLLPMGQLAFLLRLSFWESRARVEFWRKNPVRYFAPIAQRPSFTGGGSDKTGVGLFVWQNGFLGPGEILEPISWR